MSFLSLFGWFWNQPEPSPIVVENPVSETTKWCVHAVFPTHFECIATNLDTTSALALIDGLREHILKKGYYEKTRPDGSKFVCFSANPPMLDMCHAGHVHNCCCNHVHECCVNR